jgi:hypothetical protein
MRVAWGLNRCILCLDSTHRLTYEHIIPECIGGRLESDFLCSSCNADLGTRIDSVMPMDPSIVLAAQNLQNSIPRVVNPRRWTPKTGQCGKLRIRPLKEDLR